MSSILELLNHHWIFGQDFCSAWLAVDVLCCTASINTLLGVSIDRYIGVTQPLNYSSIMTIRRTVYLILIVWAVSILTSVVPLFGLTDRKTIWTNANSSNEDSEICEINKNTFYTIFSSSMSFYIPVIILLILYSRIYQEAKKQGKKLESEKRRLYELDYQIALEQARQQQNQSNKNPTENRISLNDIHDNKSEASIILINHENIHDKGYTGDCSSTQLDGVPSKKDSLDAKV